MAISEDWTGPTILGVKTLLERLPFAVLPETQEDPEGWFLLGDPA